ncbi:Stf0 family sulfotransferase [Micromonospora sp. NPDC048868]|uniref:Stf0 family sulfotransferase n=1 Tax=Micromonospora sp. NPDC048868 TaxID=3364258 RepID=UPI003723C166
MSLTYVVCATPRVGSTYLCEALGRVPGAGSPREWFGRPRIHHLAGTWDLRAPQSTMDEPRLTDPSAYLRRVRAEADSGGVLALKLHWNQVEWSRDNLGVDPLAVLEGRQDVRFIRLYRDDLVLQTVSSYLASVTKEYVRWAGTGHTDDDEFRDAVAGTPAYDFDVLLDTLQALAVIEHGWSPFFAERDTAPHTLSYEELDDDLAGSVNGVLEYLGLPRQSVVTSPVVRQRTAANDDLAERFRSDLVSSGVADALPADLRRRCGVPV